MLDASLRYLSYIEQALQEIKACELDAINQAGDLIGESIAEGRVFHIFGSGHSELIAYDCFARAGGLACANKITDPRPRSGRARRRVYPHYSGAL